MATTLGAIPLEGRRIVCAMSSRRIESGGQTHPQVGEGSPDAGSLQHARAERGRARDSRLSEYHLNREKRGVDPRENSDLLELDSARPPGRDGG